VTAVRCRDDKTAERVFWSVNSLEVRTAMTGAALKSAFVLLDEQSELPSLWAKIAETVPRLARKRNELAHGNWIGMGWATTNGVRHDQFFAPYYGKAKVDAEPYSDRPGYDPRPKKRLYVRDLEARKIEFSTLMMDVRHLMGRLSFELGRASARTEEAARLLAQQARPSANRTRRETPRRPKPPAE
jgi:hypothetical protein